QWILLRLLDIVRRPALGDRPRMRRGACARRNSGVKPPQLPAPGACLPTGVDHPECTIGWFASERAAGWNSGSPRLPARSRGVVALTGSSHAGVSAPLV